MDSGARGWATGPKALQVAASPGPCGQLLQGSLAGGWESQRGVEEGFQRGTYCM